MTDTIHTWARPGLTTEQRAAIARDYHYGSYDLVKEACDAAVAQALADAATKVEWVPYNSHKRPDKGTDIYAADKTHVVCMSYAGWLPTWSTHFAVVPPRKLPAPPQEEEK